MKKLLAVFMIILLLFSLTACSEEEEVFSIDTDTEWAIYWYLCGSDLETEYGAATNDLIEMLSVELPENVQIVVQTGGAQIWQNELISADVLQRYVYDSEGFNLIEEKPLANMGDPETLKDFLSYARENYPAKRTAVILWNHGGGSVSGVAFDENFGMDSLTLAEMYQTFAEVFGENPQNQPLDIIGFDACLMATVDTAYAFSDIAKYLVASEELEPGNGWEYSGIMQALTDNPTIRPLELAKRICDTYVEGSKAVGTEDYITLSVTNLSKLNDLLVAYDDFGKEALVVAADNPSFFANFAKIANTTENYGGNTREQGFTNMADLGHLARKAGDLLPNSSSILLTTLDECIEYRINGKYRAEATGLSCYYPYDTEAEDFETYLNIGPSEAFKHLYEYNINGTLSDMGLAYLEELDLDSLPELLTLASVDWEDMPVSVDEEGCATLELGSIANDVLSSITFELYYADVEEDIMLCLGTDNDIIADWENGVFKDNFRGVWGSLDGALCYMEIDFEGEDYNRYAVPILLNDEEYNLMVVYDFITEEYYIEGARKPLDENGAADKNLRYLVEGDIIQTIHYATVLSEESDELTSVPIDTITVTPETSFAEIELGDGLFVMMFVMQDSQGNTASSAAFTFEDIDGEIFTSAD